MINIKKLTAAATAAVIAAGMMTVTASAVFDPLTGAEFTGTYGKDYTRNPVTRQLYELPKSGKRGLCLIDGIMVKNDGSGVTAYTGKATVKGNIRYYDNGVLWTGWKKINGKWFYFDPANNGNMAKGQIETAVGTYFLGEDGSWDGKLMKSAKMPENFAFSVRENFYGSFFELNSGKNYLIQGESEEQDVKRSLKLSNSDLQIFYDTAVSDGLFEMNSKMTGAQLNDRQRIRERRYTENSDMPTYTVYLKASDDSKKIEANYYMFQFCGRDDEADSLAHFLRFVDSYSEELPEYNELKNN